MSLSYVNGGYLFHHSGSFPSHDFGTGEALGAKKAAPAAPPAIAGLARCFIEAIDSLIVARDYAQSRGIDLRLHLEVTGADLQDLAATLYIAQAKAANVALMNRNESLRRENGR